MCVETAGAATARCPNRVNAHYSPDESHAPTAGKNGVWYAEASHARPAVTLIDN